MVVGVGGREREGEGGRKGERWWWGWEGGREGREGGKERGGGGREVGVGGRESGCGREGERW
jgi:hypothetical protein